MKCSRTFAALVACALALPLFASARAQQISPSIHFGGTGGISLPLSDYSTTHDLGYYISGLGEGQPAGAPFRIRGEVSYSGYNYKGGGANDNILGFIGDLVLPAPSVGPGFYGIGGIGLYHLSRAGGGVTENDFGINFGAGIKWQLADMSTFAEVRYHYISSAGASTQIIPITFGVIF